jgi:Zn ribbon nucleic-acid-binding protein/mRNA-degrading endonuclease HigB of HigAB toxin-antitoxin module
MGRKKIHEEFVKEVYELVGNEYSVLGEYRGNKNKLLIKHNKCGFEYEVSPNGFLSKGSRCPKCAGRLPYTTKTFKEAVYNLVGDEYNVLGIYIRSNIKILIIHNKCGYEWNVIPNNFLRGDRCPKCAGNLPYTTETFKEKVYELVGNEYSVIGEYKSTLTKILMKHNKCDFEWEITPNSFLKGNRCLKCSGRMPYTTETFREKIKELVGNEYSLLSRYGKDNKDKVLIKHNMCGNEFKMKPNVFLNGCRCPKCFGTPRKTTEEFKKEVFNLVGNEYKVLGEYKNRKTKILLKHVLCGSQFKMNPNSFINGIRCPKCMKEQRILKITKTHEQFCKEVFNLVGYNYRVLGNYINGSTKIELLHSECGNIYSVIPNDFLSGTRCPKCMKKQAVEKIKMTQEQFYDRVYQLVGDIYEVLGKYINSATKILMRHNECNFQWYVNPNSFLGGSRCPKCAGKYQYTAEDFKQKIYDLVKDEYIVIGNYVNTKTKVMMKHNLCGCNHYYIPSDFFNGHRCPICNESKGERKIRYYFEENNIKHERQYTFDDCRRINFLPFDFAIFGNDGKLKFLTEYDGVFHYKPVMGKEQFEYQQENDQIKNTYCQINNIKLLRIPYWEFDNIENILDNVLNNN